MPIFRREALIAPAGIRLHKGNQAIELYRRKGFEDRQLIF
jgi:hypothetical protein